MKFIKKIILSMFIILSAGLYANNDNKGDFIHMKSKLLDKGEIRVVVMLKEEENISKNARMLNIASSQKAVMESFSSDSVTLHHQFKLTPALSLTIRNTDALDNLEVNDLVSKVDIDVGGKGGLNVSILQINADNVHSTGITGLGVTVATLDTGVDTDHSDLADDIVGQACFCNGYDGGAYPCCPNGSDRQYGTGSAEDDHGHGTHVAGIITSNGSLAPLGIAPDTNIYSVKVLADNNSFNSTSDITAALEYLALNEPNLKAVNMSLGTYERFSGYCDNVYSWTQLMANTVSQLNNNGTHVIASAGNSGDTTSMELPACLSNVIAVGAVDDNDNVASFTNSNSVMDIWAPGVGILSSMINNTTASWNGTSMAAPHITSVMALIGEANPEASFTMEQEAIKESSVLITNESNGITKPRLDAEDAVNYVKKDNVNGVNPAIIMYLLN